MRSPSLIIEAPTNADSSQPNPDPPDWSVEYNPDINKSLSLHLANTFTFTDVVFCTKFSRDGKYLAVGLRNGEIHIYCMTTGSKRSILLYFSSSQLIGAFRIRVLARRSATVFYTDAAEPLTGIWTVQFSPDSKYIATGGYDGKINVVERFLFFSEGIISSNHFRYLKLTEEDYVPFSNMKEP
jgi:hypothetical protein